MIIIFKKSGLQTNNLKLFVFPPVRQKLCWEKKHTHTQNRMLWKPLRKPFTAEWTADTDKIECVFLPPLSRVNRCDINSVDSNRKQIRVAVGSLWGRHICIQEVDAGEGVGPALM